MEFEDGLTIVAAVGTEENELASERIGPLQGELDFFFEGRLTVDIAAHLVVDLSVETATLYHQESPPSIVSHVSKSVVSYLRHVPHVAP